MKLLFYSLALFFFSFSMTNAMYHHQHSAAEKQFILDVPQAKFPPSFFSTPTQCELTGFGGYSPDCSKMVLQAAGTDILYCYTKVSGDGVRWKFYASFSLHELLKLEHDFPIFGIAISNDGNYIAIIHALHIQGRDDYTTTKYETHQRTIDVFNLKHKTKIHSFPLGRLEGKLWEKGREIGERRCTFLNLQFDEAGEKIGVYYRLTFNGDSIQNFTSIFDIKKQLPEEAS